MTAREYREWNQLIFNQVPETFSVPTKLIYSLPTWVPSAEADSISQAIIRRDDSLYLRHRLHFFRWAIYADLERAGKLTNETHVLELRAKTERQLLRATTKQCADLVSSGVGVNAAVIKGKEEFHESRRQRLLGIQKKIMSLLEARDKLYERTFLYEQVWHILEKCRVKEDEQRRTDGRRQIWDLPYGDLPGPDEASADGDTPPPSPPPSPPRKAARSLDDDAYLVEALEALKESDELAKRV